MRENPTSRISILFLALHLDILWITTTITPFTPLPISSTSSSMGRGFFCLGALFPFCLLSYKLTALCEEMKKRVKKMYYHDHQYLPRLHCHPQIYIGMVQHLIERCLLLRMSRDGCVRALAERASIEPLVTLTVWKELVKENRGFFQPYYFKQTSLRPHAYKYLQSASRFRRRNCWK